MVLLATAKSKKVDHLRERRNNERQYVFDVVFGANSTQDEVYTATTPRVTRWSCWPPPRPRRLTT